MKKIFSKSYFNKFDNLKVKYRKDPKKMLILVTSIIMAFSILVGSSYAYLTYISKTNNKVTISAGTLALSFENEANAILLTNGLPQEDKDALEKNEEYAFTIKNNGSVNSNFKITLENTCTTDKSYTINGESITVDKCIPNKYIKVGLKEGTDGVYEILSYNEEEESYILDSNYLNAGESRNYKMKIWLDYNTPNDYNSAGGKNIVYSAKVGLSYEQGKETTDKNSYIVKYDANGGEGSMSDSTFTYGTSKALSKNTFTKAGYTFTGWSTLKDGTANYSDEEVVKDLTTTEKKVITLYAVWGKGITYTVAYSMNGAESKQNEIWEYGQTYKIEKPAKKFTVNITNNVGASLSTTSVSASQIFAGWTANSSLNTTTAEYGNSNVLGNNWTNYTTKADATHFRNLRQASGTVTLTANWTPVAIVLPTITKTGHTCGYSTSSTGSTITYSSGASYTPSATGNSTTLYAVCNPNKYTITYNMNGFDTTDIIDSTTVTGCSSSTKKVTYGQQIGELCTPSRNDGFVFLGWFEATPAKHDSSKTYKTNPLYYYADTYDDIYNAFGYDEASLWNHYDTYILNGTENRRISQYISTDTYNTAGNKTLYAGWYRLWEGIPAGTYSVGDTVSYAGQSWTVAKDNGYSVGLALNEVFGTGAYTDAISYLTSNFLETNSILLNDKNNSGLFEQRTTGSVLTTSDSRYPITTDSGISEGYTSKNYYVSSTKFYNATVDNKYTVSSEEWTAGQNNYRSLATTNTGNLSIYTFNSVLNSTAYNSSGIVSTTSNTIADGTYTIPSGNYTTSTKTTYYSKHGKLNAFTTGSTTRIDNDWENIKYSSGSWSTTGSGNLSTTYRFTYYVCGGSNHGKQVVYRYKNDSTLYYGNQGTGTGWNSDTTQAFNLTDAASYSYSTSDGYRMADFAGYASTDCTAGTNCTSTTISGYTRYYRKYYFNNYNSNAYCYKPTIYSVSDKTETIYYRPYIVVRER